MPIINPLAPAEFSPTWKGFSGQGAFRYWAQTVLPAVYDDSLSYQELLAKVVQILNVTIEDVANAGDDVTGLKDAYEQLESYVNEYFSEMDVQEEINNKLDALVEDGTLNQQMEPYLSEYAEEVASLTEEVAGLTASVNETRTTLESDYTVTNGRISNIIAHNNDSTSNTELIDIRTDWKGTTHNSAGDAVRAQFPITTTQLADGAVTDAKFAKPQLGLSHESRSTIPENSDLNDYTTPGTYKITTYNIGSTIANTPNPNAGALIVMFASQNNDIVQFYVQTSSTSATSLYYRAKRVNAEWSAWQTLGTKQELDTMSSFINTEMPKKLDSETYWLIYKILGMMKYFGDDADLPIGSTAAEYVAAIRKGPKIELNGQTLSSMQYVKISGQASRGATFAWVKAQTNDLGLVNGHNYQIVKQDISGSASNENNDSPVKYVIRYGENGTKVIESWNDSLEFIWQHDEPGVLMVEVSPNTTVSNFKFSIDIIDLDEQKNYGAFSGIENNIETTFSNIEADIEAINYVREPIGLGSIPSYRVPIAFYNDPNAIINDLVYSDLNGTETKANITQSICTDGVKYLYYNIAPMGDNLGREVPQKIRKYDVISNQIVATSEQGDYGHCESCCFVPHWMKGLDNGSVDRLYFTDINFSTSHNTGYYIHVFNAATLEHITSFQTDTLIDNESWAGVRSVFCSTKRGLLCVVSESESRDVIIAVYNSEGTFIKGIKTRRYTGTICDGDCDDSYIYIVIYDSNGRYIDVITWDLEPITVANIDNVEWELEGMCHINGTVYFAYNQIAGSNRKNAIHKATPVINYYPPNTTFPVSWPNSDKIDPNFTTL